MPAPDTEESGVTRFAIVIPATPGREENLMAVLGCLEVQTVKPAAVVIVWDNAHAGPGEEIEKYDLPIRVLFTAKHKPGEMQPRNRGVRYVETKRRQVTHAAFLDSDILVQPHWLEHYERAIEQGGPEGIYYGPYEWLGPKKRQIDPLFKNDTRWPMFEEASVGKDLRPRFVGDLSKGLGCYSGNLVWNIADFCRVGGFWNELHNGRCEDGELGLRAVGMGVPIGLVPEARGWHLWHGGPPNPTPEWLKYACGINDIDVPKIQERHPWVEGSGLFVVEEDGKRFDVRCVCGWSGNTALIWEHQARCPAC